MNRLMTFVHWVHLWVTKQDLIYMGRLGQEYTFFNIMFA